MDFVNVGAHSWASLGRGDDVVHSWGANQGFITSGDNCIVIDSGFHPQTANQVLRQVRKHHPVHLLLVNTHYHSDHVFGNNVFVQQGATVTSQEKCRRKMQTQSHRLLAKYKARDPRLFKLLKNVQVSLPTVTYQDRLSIFLDDEVQVEILHPGTRAHTDGDSMIHVPTDHVVYAGDVLWVRYHPNLEDSDLQGQVKALKTILRWKPRKVVPGHGPVAGLTEVRLFIRYLEELHHNVQSLSEERLPMEEMVRRAIPSRSQGWKLRSLAEAYVRKAWENSHA